jgi:hypothetical protein
MQELKNKIVSEIILFFLKLIQKSFIPFLVLVFGILLFSNCNNTNSTDSINRKKTLEEDIWLLEESYFNNLYKANHDSVLSLVHDKFLGWPGSAAQPVDKEGSALFMKQYFAIPKTCTIYIKRSGIRLLDKAALTQYTLDVNCIDSTGTEKLQSSRITHTWLKENEKWHLLGGMSYDK